MLRKCAAVFAIACIVCGCAADPFRGVTRTDIPTAAELDETPFFPQEQYQCGPAALATVLVASGVEVVPDHLISKVYLPERRGSLQAELLAAGREYGRIPYVIAPDFSALLVEVSQGRPVLVLQNLGINLFPFWHYAVVIGFSRERQEVILRSGPDERRVTDAGVFANTWRRSDNWGVVALKPGELPASEDGTRYLRAVAAAESAGREDLSGPSYAAAVERWPDNGLAWLGLGNSAYGRDEMEVAERMYRRALELDADNAVVLNNLASTVADLGRCDEARSLLRSAKDLPDLHDAMPDLLAETQAEIDGCR